VHKKYCLESLIGWIQREEEKERARMSNVQIPINATEQEQQQQQQQQQDRHPVLGGILTLLPEQENNNNPKRKGIVVFAAVVGSNPTRSTYDLFSGLGNEFFITNSYGMVACQTRQSASTEVLQQQ
jgi:hypothetical protein